jgi:hypothetical protein
LKEKLKVVPLEATMNLMGRKLGVGNRGGWGSEEGHRVRLLFLDFGHFDASGGVRVGPRLARKIKSFDVGGKGELGGWKTWSWQRRWQGSDEGHRNPALFSIRA